MATLETTIDEFSGDWLAYFAHMRAEYFRSNAVDFLEFRATVREFCKEITITY